MSIKFIKERADATIYKIDKGIELAASQDTTIRRSSRAAVPTGVCIILPKNYIATFSSKHMASLTNDYYVVEGEGVDKRTCDGYESEDSGYASDSGASTASSSDFSQSYNGSSSDDEQ